MCNYYRSFTFILPVFILFSVSCNKTWESQIKKTLKIEHVFSRPSTSYGPGTVVMYNKKSGYTLATSALTITKKSNDEEYLKIIKGKPIAEVGGVSEGTMEFPIKLEAIDNAKLSSELKNISKIKFELKNGMDYHMKSKIEGGYEPWELIKIIEDKNGDPYKNIKDRAERNPGSKFYLVYITYGYDMQYSVETSNGWKSNVQLPDEILKKISAQIGFAVDNSEKLNMSGKGLYIGFNGDPETIKDDNNKSCLNLFSGEIKTLTFAEIRYDNQYLSKAKVIDITDIFK